jgi:hypothetical protein
VSTRDWTLGSEQERQDSEHGRLTMSTREWTLDSEQERQDSEHGRLTVSTREWTLDSEQERQDSELGRRTGALKTGYGTVSRRGRTASTVDLQRTL